MFLMIVFFVCIDFRVLEAKLPALLPRDTGTTVGVVEPREALTIRLHVDTPGTSLLPPGGSVGQRDAVTGRPHRFRLSTDARTLLPCVIAASPGTCYDDVARTTDAAYAAGFDEIRFGGALGAK
jgi:hypothetical protein